MQALLIYKLGNKNNLKNINDQNFAHFMGGYDKGFYGSYLQTNNNQSYLLYKNIVKHWIVSHQ